MENFILFKISYMIQAINKRWSEFFAIDHHKKPNVELHGHRRSAKAMPQFLIFNEYILVITQTLYLSSKNPI